jgi:hypothetical protein
MQQAGFGQIAAYTASDARSRAWSPHAVAFSRFANLFDGLEGSRWR